MVFSSVPTPLRRPTKPECIELGGLFAAHFIGGLLPLWGSWLLIPLVLESATFGEFIRHGEFLLYAASLLPTAAFLVLRDVKVPYPHRLPLGLAIIFLLVVSTLLFAVVFTKTRNDLPSEQPSIDVIFLAWVSIPLYLASLIVTLVVTFFDMIVLSYNPIEEQMRDDTAFAKEFHNLKD